MGEALPTLGWLGAGAAGGSLLSSAMTPKAMPQSPLPTPQPKPVMPDPDDKARAVEAQRRIAARSNESGRASTILSERRSPADYGRLG